MSVVETPTVTPVGSSKELPEVMKVTEVARLLRLNSKTVYEAVARGEIPGARRVGKAIRFSRDVLLSWINDQGRVSRRTQ